MLSANFEDHDIRTTIEIYDDESFAIETNEIQCVEEVGKYEDGYYLVCTGQVYDTLDDLNIVYQADTIWISFDDGEFYHKVYVFIND